MSTAHGIAKAAASTSTRLNRRGARFDVQGLGEPKGVMRGSLLGMSFLWQLKISKFEDGVLYLKN